MDWSFLLPWADDLARVVFYKQRDEVDYGTLHDRVDFVALQLAELDVFVNAQTHDERWGELTCLREGLELVALAIHYDKSAWQFFHDHSYDSSSGDGGGSWVASSFPLDLATPERNRSDSTHALRAGVDMLTRMPTAILGSEYHTAKRRIREFAGAAWDDAYRVPVSLSFDAPTIDQDPTRWLSVVYELMCSLNDPAGAAGDALCLWPIVQSLERLPMMDFTNDLLLNVMSAYAHMPRLALALQFNDTASVAPTINDAVAICPVNTQPDERFVDTLELHGSSGTPQFAGWCSAVARAQSLVCFSLKSAFGDQTNGESSVSHLRLEEEELTRDDVLHLTSTLYEESNKNLPPKTIDEFPRAVRLADKSLVCLPGGETEPLERLGWSDADEFLVLDDECTSEWMPILVPGAPEPLPLLLNNFSTSLVRVHILMKENVVFDAIQLRTIFRQCQALRFLALRRVDIGTMDTVLDAYRAGQCRLEALSLWNSWVHAPSLTRFAFELADAHALMNCHLREFRFNYDDIDDGVNLPDEDGISAFTTMLGYNRTLTFFEIALEETLHAQYGDRLAALDGATEVSTVPAILKRALLSVVTGAEVDDDHAAATTRKKPRGIRSYVIPSESREAIARRIWRFLSPVDTITRTVSAVPIQPAEVTEDLSSSP